MLNIGLLSQETGCAVETIRYYEKEGLIPKPFRSEGNHRLYTSAHKSRVIFIRQARALGFSLQVIRDWIDLSQNGERSCGEALDLVQQQVGLVDEKIDQLQRIRHSLMVMAESCGACCPGAKAPECTIIQALSDSSPHDSLKTLSSPSR